VSCVAMTCSTCGPHHQVSPFKQKSYKITRKDPKTLSRSDFNIRPPKRFSVSDRTRICEAVCNSKVNIHYSIFHYRLSDKTKSSIKGQSDVFDFDEDVNEFMELHRKTSTAGTPATGRMAATGGKLATERPPAIWKKTTGGTSASGGMPAKGRS
jgi:hypothetical protein